MSTLKSSRAAGGIVAFAAIMSTLLAGCFETHEPVLDGERYTCLCHYDRISPTATVTILPDGGVTTMAGVPGTPERGLRHLIHPCAEEQIAPEDLCTQACVLWDDYPAGYITGSGRFDSESPDAVANYEGGGACDPEGTPPRTYIWPSVTPEAVRNGTIASVDSEVTVTISGIGSTVVTPDTGYISVSGGACEVTGGGGSGPCDPIVVEDFGFTLPTFSLGGETVTNARLAHSGEDPVEGPFEGTYRFLGYAEDHDEWDYLGGSMPLEADGFISSFPMDVRFDYRFNPGDPEGEHVLPDSDAINARQGPGWAKFIQFAGAVQRNDIDGHDLTIEFDLMFDFFSGSPLVRMTSMASTFDPNETVLDGTETIDDLGGTPVLYEWFLSNPVGNPGYEVILAYGERASVPTAALNQLVGPAQYPFTDVCLRVWDSDDYFDQYCTTWPAAPGPAPPLGCTDVGISWASTYRFRRIVERAGLINVINDYPTDFTMIIPTNALLDEVESVSPGLEEWALSSPSNANAFVSYFADAAYYPWSSLAPVTLWGIPTKPVAVDRSCGNGNPGPARTMHIIDPDV